MSSERPPSKRSGSRRSTVADPATSRDAGSLSEQAYEAIKQRIITCHYKPGEYMNGGQIAEQLGFGRTPVHQAIKRLELQGLAEIIPRKGVIVKPVSLDEIAEINEVRLINEVECVRLAAERIMESELNALRDVLARAKKARKARDITALMLLDREFHGLLARASRNSILAEFLGAIHERSLRSWFISLNDPEHLREVEDEHERVVTALAAHDAAAASAAMMEHIKSTARNLGHQHHM